MPRLVAALLLMWVALAPASAIPPSQQIATPEEFMAAMQRVRMNLPEPPDSAALKNSPIYDYLVAARLRRDLTRSPNEEVDSAIDGSCSHMPRSRSRMRCAISGWRVSLSAVVGTGSCRAPPMSRIRS